MSLFGGGGGKDGKPTAGEKALAVKGANDFNYYQNKFVPLENSFISSLESTGADRRRLGGQGVADVAQQVKGADRAIVNGTLSKMGTGLEAGRSVMQRAGLRQAEAEPRADAVTGAREASRARELDGMQKMVAFGRGLSDSASLNARNRASNEASAAASKLQNQLDRSDQNMEVLGAAVGGIGSSWNSSSSANNFGSGTNGAFNGFFGPRKL